MTIDSIPTLAQIQTSINKLKQLKFEKFVEGEDIEKYIDRTLKPIIDEIGFILNIKNIADNNIAKSSFYRAREASQFADVELIREHTYPPIHNTTMGRCNFPQKPVFYCSNNILTSLFEVVRNDDFKGKQFYVSKWEINNNIEEIIYGSFLQSELPENNYFNIIANTVREKIGEPFEKSYGKPLAKTQKDALIEYLKYLDNLFINTNNDYSLSASLAHRALYENAIFKDKSFRTDILIYPSVQTKMESVNIAISPNFVETNMSMTRVYLIEINDFDKNTGSTNIHIRAFADVKKNKFIWKSREKYEEEFKKNLNVDFGGIDISNTKFE